MTIENLSEAKKIISQEVNTGIREGRQVSSLFWRGIGGVSSQLALLRGLFATPVYKAVVNEDGQVIGYRPDLWNYQPGGLARLSVALRSHRFQLGKLFGR